MSNRCGGCVVRYVVGGGRVRASSSDRGSLSGRGFTLVALDRGFIDGGTTGKANIGGRLAAFLSLQIVARRRARLCAARVHFRKVAADRRKQRCLVTKGGRDFAGTEKALCFL